MIKVDELKLGTYETEHTALMEAFSTLDEHRETINGIVNNGNWEGASLEMCQAVLSAVSDYLDNFYTDYTNLTNAVKELRTDVGCFVSESPAVQNLT
jgi:hypothetical protein